MKNIGLFLISAVFGAIMAFADIEVSSWKFWASFSCMFAAYVYGKHTGK